MHATGIWRKIIIPVHVYQRFLKVSVDLVAIHYFLQMRLEFFIPSKSFILRKLLKFSEVLFHHSFSVHMSSEKFHMKYSFFSEWISRCPTLNLVRSKNERVLFGLSFIWQGFSFQFICKKSSSLISLRTFVVDNIPNLLSYFNHFVQLNDVSLPEKSLKKYAMREHKSNKLSS